MKHTFMTVISIATAVSLTAPVLAATQSPFDDNTIIQFDISDADDNYNADKKITVTTESEMISEEGTIRSWDKLLEDAKERGLKNPITKEMLDESGIEYKEDDIIYYIGKNSLYKVNDPVQAYSLAYRLISLFGGDENTTLYLWERTVSENQTVYTLQDVKNGMTVPGNTIKIVVTNDGVTVFNSFSPKNDKEYLFPYEYITEARIASETAVNKEKNDDIKNYSEKEKDESLAETTELSEDSENNDKIYETVTDIKSEISGIRSFEAENIVKEKTGKTILPGTERIVLASPMTSLSLEEQNDEDVPQILLYAVYTDNDDNKYPYLVHYLKLDGEYCYSLPVREIGDEDARCGYRRQTLFKGMEATTWEGDLTETDAPGIKNPRTIHVTLPVMFDRKTKEYYLGDLERRIVIADYAKAAYVDSQLHVVSSRNNRWDNEDLWTYYNYIRAYDYYAERGWIGPDGRQTDVAILKGLCSADGTPFENACSIGMVAGWQMFGYTPYKEDGTPLLLTHALDVMAHEYTHTFTSTLMVENLYKNDYGAINEAMSDIMGNIIEYSYNDTEDKNWTLGENMGMPIRSMIYPHDFGQPEHVWDIYYGPNTKKPTTVNDRGGVHTNSSMLNLIAAKLCRFYDMPLEEASRFWMTVAQVMTSNTDYKRIGSVLEWAMNEVNKDYLDALISLESECRLSETEYPERLPYHYKMVELTLPDTEAFRDNDWALMQLQLNTDTVSDIIFSGIDIAFSKHNGKDVTEKIKNLAETLHSNVEVKENMTDEEEFETIHDILASSVDNIVTQSMSWGDSTIRMVTKDAPSVYALISTDITGMKMKGLAVLINGKWYDLSSVITIIDKNEEKPEGEIKEDAITEELVDLFSPLVDILIDTEKEKTNQSDSSAEAIAENDFDEDEFEKELIYNLREIADAIENDREIVITKEAKVEELPTDGLEDVKVVTD